MKFLLILFGPFLVLLAVLTIGQIVIPALSSPSSPKSIGEALLMNRLVELGIALIAITFLVLPIWSARTIVRGGASALRRIVGGLIIWVLILGLNLFLGMLSCAGLFL